MNLMSIPRWAKVFLGITAAVIIYNANIFIHKRYGTVKWLETHPLQIHGDGSCADTIRVSESLIEKAKTMRQQCQNSASPLRTHGSWGTRIATATTHFSNPKDPQKFYQKGIETHILHSLIHGTRLHVLCTPLIDYMWNKQAFVQSILLDELSKPPQERLEWIFWADRDTVILDYCRNPASFISPKSHRSHNAEPTKEQDINLLITQDSRGLNAGVFLIRVTEWSVNFLSDVIAFRHFKPDVDLPFSEQTAMEQLLFEDRYKDNVAYIPQPWINTYAWDTAQDFMSRKEVDGLDDWASRRGDFLIHFAGNGNKELNLVEYSSVGEKIFNIWQTGDILRDVSMDIEYYWGNYSNADG